MNPALVIMSVRQIDPVVHAYGKLPIDKIWLEGYTERQLMDGAFQEMLDTTEYTHYIMASDDIVVHGRGLDLILQAMENHSGATAITGYSQRTHDDFSIVNLTDQPLKGFWPQPDSYNFIPFRDAYCSRVPLIRSYFAGMSCTGMTREMWQLFGFNCFVDDDDSPGYASDFALSRTLQDAGHPILAPRESFFYHWRSEWQHTNHPDDARVVLRDDPRTRLEVW